MHIIITLKDGTEHSMLIFELEECSIYQKTFTIVSKSLSGFRIEASRGRAWEGDSTILNPAIIILSQFLP